MTSVEEFRKFNLKDLQKEAKALGIPKYYSFRKEQLILEIIKVKHPSPHYSKKCKYHSRNFNEANGHSI
jgi:hypothetical protein